MMDPRHAKAMAAAPQGDGGGDRAPENLVYLSLNPSEAQDESEQLRAALRERGIPVYVRSHGRPSSDSETMAEIAKNLAQCTLAVVMGTTGYGEHTKAPLSTFDELQFIKCNKADYSCYFVRMCERFLEPVRKCRKAHQRHLSTPDRRPLDRRIKRKRLLYSIWGVLASFTLFGRF